MRKIIPWALPPVKGGAQGGYTPQPTPDPSPSCYDFSNASFVQSKSITSMPAGSKMNYYAYESITIQGAVIVDDSNVASIKIYADVASGSIKVVRKYSTSTQITTITVTASTGEEVTNTTTTTIDHKVWSLKVGEIKNVSSSYEGAVGTVTGAGVTVTKVEILNSAGTVIQTWEP